MSTNTNWNSPRNLKWKTYWLSHKVNWQLHRDFTQLRSIRAWEIANQTLKQRTNTRRNPVSLTYPKRRMLHRSSLRRSARDGSIKTLWWHPSQWVRVCMRPSRTRIKTLANSPRIEVSHLQEDFQMLTSPNISIIIHQQICLWKRHNHIRKWPRFSTIHLPRKMESSKLWIRIKTSLSRWSIKMRILKRAIKAKTWNQIMAILTWRHKISPTSLCLSESSVFTIWIPWRIRGNNSLMNSNSSSFFLRLITISQLKILCLKHQDLKTTWTSWVIRKSTKEMNSMGLTRKVLT